MKVNTSNKKIFFVFLPFVFQIDCYADVSNSGDIKAKMRTHIESNYGLYRDNSGSITDEKKYLSCTRDAINGLSLREAKAKSDARIYVISTLSKLKIKTAEDMNDYYTFDYWYSSKSNDIYYNHPYRNIHDGISYFFNKDSTQLTNIFFEDNNFNIAQYSCNPGSMFEIAKMKLIEANFSR